MMPKVVKILKICGIVIGAVLGAVVAFLLYLTFVEYKPANIEEVECNSGSRGIAVGDSISVITYNIGYAAYDQDEDFFMDGGTKVRPDSKDAVEANLSGISSIIQEQNADINLIQELDLDSHRSFNVNERSYMNASLGLSSVFAYNFNAVYVPFPMPPIGKVMSGVAIYSDINATEASRISLPVPFKWPVRIANLKRCILEERFPVEGTDKELVVLNFHLEAYDNGEGKIAQTKVLMEKLEEEYSMGNYVIAGGDFNQMFDTLEQFPVIYPDDWMPGDISHEELPDGFSFAVNNNAPTCRSLARSFENNELSQVYIIDGFMVSDNLGIESVKVIDTEFLYSDHNPVRLEVKIK